MLVLNFQPLPLFERANGFALLAAGGEKAQKRELLLAQKMPKNAARTSRSVHALLCVFIAQPQDC
jgi:hypothetical protein